MQGCASALHLVRSPLTCSTPSGEHSSLHCFCLSILPFCIRCLAVFRSSTSPGVKLRVRCNPDDTIADLKKLIAAQTGTRAEKLRIQKFYTVYKDHIMLSYVSSRVSSRGGNTASSQAVIGLLFSHAVVIATVIGSCLTRCAAVSLREVLAPALCLLRSLPLLFFLLAAGTMRLSTGRRWKSTTTRGPCGSQLCTLVQALANRLVASFLAVCMLLYRGSGELRNKPPIFKYLMLFVSNLIIFSCQYEALQWVPFPTQSLAKCAQMIPDKLVPVKLIPVKLIPVITCGFVLRGLVGPILRCFDISDAAGVCASRRPLPLPLIHASCCQAAVAPQRPGTGRGGAELTPT